VKKRKPSVSSHIPWISSYSFWRNKIDCNKHHTKNL